MQKWRILQSLADYLKLQGPTLTEDAIKKIFLPILDGLQEVHKYKLLHRDIKPGNIYLRTDSSSMLIDFGAVINGYHSDMTRTFVLGKADNKQREIYQTVLAAQQASINAFNAEMTGAEIYHHALQVLNKSPYAEYQGEGLGHGVGMDLHEFPFIGLGCELTVRKHCVITIEPGIYIPGWGGVRIEDDVVLTDNGLEYLTQFPRELMEL